MAGNITVYLPSASAEKPHSCVLIRISVHVLSCHVQDLTGSLHKCGSFFLHHTGPKAGHWSAPKKDKYYHTVMLMEIDGREWKGKRTKSRDERGSESALTVDRRLQHNCFPHDCQYRVSKIKQTDLEGKVTTPLNRHWTTALVVERKCRFSQEVRKTRVQIRAQ